MPLANEVGLGQDPLKLVEPGIEVLKHDRYYTSAFCCWNRYAVFVSDLGGARGGRADLAKVKVGPMGCSDHAERL